MLALVNTACLIIAQRNTMVRLQLASIMKLLCTVRLTLLATQEGLNLYVQATNNIKLRTEVLVLPCRKRTTRQCRT
jgi:hypothetical protein